MPELPEVETVCIGLRKHLVKQIIHDVVLNRSGLRYPFVHDLALRLQNKLVTQIARRGKYIIIKLQNCDYSLLWHLGMSGKVTVIPENKLPVKYAKHDHVIFKISNGCEIRFADPRRFGFLKLLANDSIPTSLNLGVEPLSQDLTAKYLYAKFTNKTNRIKTTLLDQKIIAGLGNIYACEALFMSKIHPLQTTNSINIDQLQNLIINIKQILQQAIKAGGSSLKDHQQISGEKGYFQYSFTVYGKTGEICSVCNITQITNIKISGRSSFFCPNCQKII